MDSKCVNNKFVYLLFIWKILTIDLDDANFN